MPLRGNLGRQDAMDTLLFFFVFFKELGYAGDGD